MADIQSPHFYKKGIIYYFLIIILGLYFGFFIGGYFKDYNHYNLTLSDLITSLFSFSLVYFAWIQSNYIDIQYKLSYESSLPNINIIHNGNNRFFHIKNSGNLNASDIKCRLYNWTLDQWHDYDIITELFAEESQRLYFPQEWKIRRGRIIEIYLDYLIDKKGNRRKHTEQIEF
jgi:hypothetical protein